MQKRKSRRERCNVRGGRGKSPYNHQQNITNKGECQMLLMNFEHKKDTKTCNCFECRDSEESTVLYLKKTQVKDAGIDPQKGITVTIDERK